MFCSEPMCNTVPNPGITSEKDIDNGKAVTEVILKACVMRKIDI